MTDEQINASGVLSDPADSAPEQLAPEHQAEQLSPEDEAAQDEFMAMAERPAEPHQYAMPALIDEAGRYMAEADQQARAWLTGAQFPREVGSSVAQEVARVAAQYEGMGESARELWARSERATLERLWRGEFDRKIALARQLVGEVEAKAPGLKDLLERSGAGNSSMVIGLLAMQAERLSKARDRRSRNGR
jgi:hypothetical protein